MDMKRIVFRLAALLLGCGAGIASAQDAVLVPAEEMVEKLAPPARGENDLPFRVRGIQATETLQPQVTVQILFAFGTAEIADAFSRLQLNEAGKALSSDALSGMRIEIAGHTDSIGAEEANLRLSRERARAVKDFLCERHGISPDRLICRGYGESRPVASNETEEGRARNRRVVFRSLSDAVNAAGE